MLADARLQTIVCTARIREAERFYGEVLGLCCKGRSHGALVYDVGGAELRLSPVATTTPSAHAVLGFAVADVAAAAAGLEARGVRLERFAGFAHDAAGLVTLADGTRVAWLRDVDGNLLSLVQYA
ncbi:MAG TPA: VOC family protein [Steroidobacteraceae bacterium]|nr:VOC family protein [Steroidobacteraceae bacterium]